jgi:hypothetical protein
MKPQLADIQFAIKLRQALFQGRISKFQRQVAETKVQQLIVGQAIESASHNLIVST